MKEENYLEGIYGCLERIEKKVETLPVEGTSPAVGNRTSSPEGIAELKIRLERLQSAVEKNGLEIAAVRNHTVRLSEGWPLSAETFAGEMEKIRVLRNKWTPLQIVITNGYTCSIFQVAKITRKTEITKKGVWLCSLFCLIPIYLPSYF